MVLSFLKHVRHRDNYTCQYCKNKSGNKRLDVHHIVFRKDGRSDNESNLVTLCKSCHDNLHNEIQQKWQEKGQLKHATQMNSIRQQL